MFKIKQINPVSSEVWVDVNLKIINEFKNPDTDVHIVTIKQGPKEIKSFYDEAKVIPYVVEEAQKAQREGFDAVAMSCFMDIGLDAMREALEIPVLGACQAAIHLASLLGSKFTIITSDDSFKAIETIVHKYGFKSKLASIRQVDLSPLQFALDKSELKRKALIEAKEAIKKDEAEVIILGCSGMNIGTWLQNKIHVPVVDPLIAVIKLLEVLMKMNLSHSKRAYPKP